MKTAKDLELSLLIKENTIQNLKLSMMHLEHSVKLLSDLMNRSYDYVDNMIYESEDDKEIEKLLELSKILWSGLEWLKNK